tara:strand:+ start:2022 stop:2132 length:111 start_codon:yes stop_codon:yes gene_type:complete
MKALTAQGKTDEAEEIKRMFDIVWRKSDMTRDGSRL